MAYLPDTNVALRLVNEKDPLHQIVSQAIEHLRQNSEELVIVPQILIEFWVVATRPKTVNGFGMTIEEAAAALTKLQILFKLIPENEHTLGYGKR